MDVDYLQGGEAPTAELMDDLFAALDGKLTTLLGGRSFFLAQTAALPQYLIGKTFFFTAGGAVYAPRVPGYIETNTSAKPVARPYNHAQFTAAQATMVVQPGYVKTVTIEEGGAGFLLNDVITMAGGTVAAGGQPAQIQVTQRDTLGQIVAFNLINPGSYTVLPPTPNTPIAGGGGHGNGATFNLAMIQFDMVNKVAPITKLGSTYYQGLPVAADVGLFEWSLAAHSIWHQGQTDKTPVRYYLQDGAGVPGSPWIPATMPEKHFKFALAEIIIEGVTTVNIPKAWDKYACFRIHNLNPKPASVVFEDGYTVSLTAFQCATVRRDWNGTAYQNYRPGYNYFFKFEGGDPKSYWFFPASGVDGYGHPTLGTGGKAANSMQANNLVNPAGLLDWVLAFLRKPDGSTTFAGWNEDASVQADSYASFQNLFGDPSNPKTLVGDLLHHPGEIAILRKPKMLYQVQHVIVDNGGKGYVVNDQLVVVGGVMAIYTNAAAGLILPLNAVLQVTAVDAKGGIVAASIATVTAIVPLTGGLYVKPPPAYCTVSGGTGSGALFSVICGRVSSTGNPYTAGQIFGVADAVKFRGYQTLVADFAAKQLAVAENSGGNLVIKNADLANDVYLFPISTNLLKTGETLPAMVDLSGTNSFTIESAIFESEPEQAYLDNYTLSVSAPQLISHPDSITVTPQNQWVDVFDVVGPATYIGTYPNGYWSPPNPDPVNYTLYNQGTAYYYRNPIVQNGLPQTVLQTIDYNLNPILPRSLQLYSAAIADGGGGYVVGDTLNPNGGTLGSANLVAEIQVTAVAGGKITGIQIVQRGGYASVPASANAVAGGSGAGAILNLVFLNSFNAVHKRTVADLLTLDWWGDPQHPGQNSQRVTIENRRLQFTPQGLVLTFTETDVMDGSFAGEYGVYNPMNTLCFMVDASWMLKSGQPRDRQIRFRLHGWGYCGTAYGNGAVPPSGKSAIWSPLRGRQAATGAYRGEVVAPNGADFFVKGWSFGAPSPIAMLTRIEPANLTSDGRFWKLHGDATWQFVFPANMYLEALSLFLGGNVSLSPAAGGVYFYSAATFVNAPPPVMALGLVAEMYNALARAVNSITTGTPLMWQCLLFNVGGTVVGLPIDNAYSSTPRPINQFASFGQGSIQQALFNQLGVPVKTENDLPGGMDEFGRDAALAYFQSKFTAPAVYCDFAHSEVVSASVSSSTDPATNITTVVSSLTSKSTIATELLSTAAILAGNATGSHCLGTYDPTKYSAGGYGFNGQGQYVLLAGYPDFTNAPPGAYYLANDGSGKVATAAGQSTVTAATGSAFLKGVAFLEVPAAPGGQCDLTNSFTGYRWVQIEDVMAFVRSLGLEFLWCEACQPLELRYYEDPTRLATIADQSTATRTSQSTATFYPYTYPPYQGDAAATAALLATAPQNSVSFSDSGNPGHGCVLKFVACREAAKARWKTGSYKTLSNLASPNPAYSAALLQTNVVEICNLVGHQAHSPFFRYVSNWGLRLDSGGFAPGVRPSSVPVAQLAVEYVPKNPATFSGLISTSYADAVVVNVVGTNPPVYTYSSASIFDQRETLAFNLYASKPIAALPVRLGGIYAWKKTVDWWGSLDTAYAAASGYYPMQNSSRIPSVFLPPAESLLQYVTDYFDGAGQNGLTLIEAQKDQRFWVWFDPSFFDLNLVTFNSQDYS